MREFPALKKQQIALLWFDFKTGILLDIEFMKATRKTQFIYTIFENLDYAIAWAKSVIMERKNIECNIYNFENKLLVTLTPIDVDSSEVMIEYAN